MSNPARLGDSGPAEGGGCHLERAAGGGRVSSPACRPAGRPGQPPHGWPAQARPVQRLPAGRQLAPTAVRYSQVRHRRCQAGARTDTSPETETGTGAQDVTRVNRTGSGQVRGSTETPGDVRDGRTEQSDSRIRALVVCSEDIDEAVADPPSASRSCPDPPRPDRARKAAWSGRGTRTPAGRLLSEHRRAISGRRHCPPAVTGTPTATRSGWLTETWNGHPALRLTHRHRHDTEPLPQI